MIMVGARVRDGGGPVSDVQRACRQHAQRIGVGTLFNPVARIEAVQAMSEFLALGKNRQLIRQSCWPLLTTMDGCQEVMLSVWLWTWVLIALS